MFFHQEPHSKEVQNGYGYIEPYESEYSCDHQIFDGDYMRRDEDLAPDRWVVFLFVCVFGVGGHWSIHFGETSYEEQITKKH